MRTARITYKGAYHHIISRGLNGKDIFLDDLDRNRFCYMLEKKAGLYGISVFAYSIMPNHYHLVICNATGRMSDMMRVLNGGFAAFFRKRHGGKGYLYQDRYRSTLIESKKYVWRVIQYALINPSVAGICKNAFDYKWSSINYYFSPKRSFVETSLVESLFGTKKEFRKAIDEYQDSKLDIRKGRFGYVIGGSKFEEVIEKKFDRRKLKSEIRHAYMRSGRKENLEIRSKQEILKAFKIYFGIENLQDFLEKSNHESKRKADMLIKLLKDEGGMSYREISRELGLKFSSLGHRYKRAIKRELPSNLLRLISGGK